MPKRGASISRTDPAKKTPFNPFSVGRLNQRAGAQWEKYIPHACMLERLLCVNNGLKAKRLGDRVVGLRSDLDWSIYGNVRVGEVACVDSKSFAGPRFGRSQLEGHQVLRALKYAEHNVVSGFLVLLRDSDQVGFFSAATIVRKADRAGFCIGDGVLLGTRIQFSLRRIFQGGR